MYTRRNAALAAFIIVGILVPCRMAASQEAAAPAAPLPIADAPTVAASADAPLQMPVCGGSITLKVTNFLAAREQVLDAAAKAGAQITDGKTFVTGNGRKNGYVRLQVTANKLTDLLHTVRGVGTLYSDNLFTTDQISDYQELGRRISTLKQHEGRLETLLSSSRRLRGSDILYVQERLFRASTDESLLEQQQVDQQREAHTATITVTLFEPIPPPVVSLRPVPAEPGKIDLAHGFANARRRASLHFQLLLSSALTAAAFALVYAPLWLPVFIAAVLLLRLLWLRRIRFVHWVVALCLSAAERFTALRHAPPAPQ